MTRIGDHLRLLADDTRLRILHLLRREALTVAELQQVLDLSQSSISGHLAKLKQAGMLHDLAEGSARRYRLRADIPPELAQTWTSIADLSDEDAQFRSDHQRLIDLHAAVSESWIDRVAGQLDRAYAPGRNWDSLSRGLLLFTDFGHCVDIGAGDGAMLEVLAPQCHSLICVDSSSAMVQAGEQRCRDLDLDNVRYHRCAGESLPLADAAADSVLFLQSLQYMSDPAAALAEAQRILRPGGGLLILTLAAHDHGEAARYGHLHRGFTVETMRSWCSELEGIRSHLLPAESKPPRFQSLILFGRRRAP